MSGPKKNHYLPQFFMARWTGGEGKLTEYTRPYNDLVCQQKFPSQTGFMTDLYANETKADPSERQALEIIFLQKVDSQAANALKYLEDFQSKPTDLGLRDAWSRFLMSLMHRSPERVRHLMSKIREYEDGTLNPKLRKNYLNIKGLTDPETFDEWLAKEGSLTPELLTKLLRRLMDSEMIGTALNSMHWHVHAAKTDRFGFLSGDQPLMMSNGLGHKRGFVALAISPSRLFLAANDKEVIGSFVSQRHNALEQAFNDACARQSQHVLIGRDDSQRAFVERRLNKTPPSLRNDAMLTWNAPLFDRRPVEARPPFLSRARCTND